MTVLAMINAVYMCSTHMYSVYAVQLGLIPALVVTYKPIGI